MDKYPEHILRRLRQREDLEETDTSMDERFNNYSPKKAFREVCEWEGFLGWDGQIKRWIEDIYGIQLDKQ